MKWVIIAFQALLAFMFLMAVAGGTMGNIQNTVSVVIIVGIVLGIMHIARANK
jgi:uncharacterized membrane protein (UPF0136 family)